MFWKHTGHRNRRIENVPTGVAPKLVKAGSGPPWTPASASRKRGVDLLPKNQAAAISNPTCPNGQGRKSIKLKRFSG
jgi:hypothetical protein